MCLKLFSYYVHLYFHQLWTTDIFCKFTLEVTSSLEAVRGLPVQCSILWPNVQKDSQRSFKSSIRLPWFSAPSLSPSPLPIQTVSSLFCGSFWKIPNWLHVAKCFLKSDFNWFLLLLISLQFYTNSSFFYSMERCLPQEFDNIKYSARWKWHNFCWIKFWLCCYLSSRGYCTCLHACTPIGLPDSHHIYHIYIHGHSTFWLPQCVMCMYACPGGQDAPPNPHCVS